MTQREEIAQLRSEVRRLRTAMQALLGLEEVLDSYSAGWSDGAAGRPPASLDPATVGAAQRIAARLNGTEAPRHLRPVPTA